MADRTQAAPLTGPAQTPQSSLPFFASIETYFSVFKYLFFV